MYLLSIPMHTLMSTISLTLLYSLLKGSLGCFHWGLRWSRPAFQNGNCKSFVIASERRGGPWSARWLGRFGTCYDAFWIFLEHVNAFLSIWIFWHILNMFELLWELWNTLRLLWTHHWEHCFIFQMLKSHIEKSILKKPYSFEMLIYRENPVPKVRL